MNQSIHKFFQVGTIHFMSYPQTMRGEGPILATLQRILCDDFFDAVEISWIRDPETRRQARRMMDVSGVKVCYGAQPRLLTTGLNPNDLDEGRRLEAQQTLLEAVDEAGELGAAGVAFLAGKYDPARMREAYAQLLKTTRTLCGYAAKKGIAVNLEVFDYDVDKKSLIGPAPLAAEFAADMAGEAGNFGLIVDLSHIPQTHETSAFVLHTLRPYIRHLHFGNAVVADPSMEAYGDTHPRFGFPNSANGVADIVEFLRAMRAEGLFNAEDPLVLSFEVKPWGDEDAELVLASSKRALNRAWALLEDE
jgi:sugar phosphate isomerase/epimerase